MNEKMLTDEQMKTRLDKILNSPITDPLEVMDRIDRMDGDH